MAAQDAARLSFVVCCQDDPSLAKTQDDDNSGAAKRQDNRRAKLMEAGLIIPATDAVGLEV
ncbi:MAG: hypothetical protein WBB85_05160 [Albidovulum sp.]|uniref:hypothetical protein n=1 Tax=Albidovulum sp. TaxID=1872424 RepID=UPI003CB06CC9